MQIQNYYSVFTKNEIHYCIPIENVREVVRTESLILSPLQINGFLGFIDFRKTLCPVLDIYDIINSKESTKQNISITIMVIEYESILFAVQIDRFIESIKPEDDEEKSDSTISNQQEKMVIDRVFRYNQAALFRLDLLLLKNLILKNIHNKEQESKAVESIVTNQTEVLDEIEMICFKIDNFLFGIPITDLIEVVEGYGMQPLFRVNKMLRGLINLRGQIIACVDISEIVGLKPRKMEEKSQYILIQNGNSDLALCIDSISKKQKFSRHEVQNVETIFSGELGEYLMGIIEKNSERIFVISGPKIFESKHLLPNRE